jgi:hypothetical protein
MITTQPRRLKADLTDMRRCFQKQDHPGQKANPTAPIKRTYETTIVPAQWFSKNQKRRNCKDDQCNALLHNLELREAEII